MGSFQSLRLPAYHANVTTCVLLLSPLTTLSLSQDSSVYITTNCHAAILQTNALGSGHLGTRHKNKGCVYVLHVHRTSKGQFLPPQNGGDSHAPLARCQARRQRRDSGLGTVVGVLGRGLDEEILGSQPTRDPVQSQTPKGMSIHYPLLINTLASPVCLLFIIHDFLTHQFGSFSRSLSTRQSSLPSVTSISA